MWTCKWISTRGMTDELPIPRNSTDNVSRYLIHAPYFAKTEKELQAAWASMERVKASGKARSIGVSNFLQSDLETILKTAEVVPSVNQIEFHPYLQHGNLVPFQESKGIKTVSYGGLSPITRAQGGPLDPLLSSLATKYGVHHSEILLRWIIDRGCVAITTSGKESRLSSYLRVFTFKLTPQEVDEISTIGEQKHYRAFWREKFAEGDRS
jgi:diketogulonate reductase-like aldo/keto reductase